MDRIVYRSPDACAVCEDGRLTEYIRLSEETQSGNIIMAKVDRMMQGMACAFADIGRKKDGFLPLKENSRSFTDGPIRSGDRVAVQIRREEAGDKGAFLSRDLTIPGRTVILMPKNRYIGVSSRIEDEGTRERLRETGTIIAGGRYGLVMRAAAANATKEEIRAEAEDLSGKWLRIMEKKTAAFQPGDILYEQDPVAQIIRDYAVPEDKVIQLPAIPAEVTRQLSAASERKVQLPDGGNIVIDRCEAMTVIDVNSAAAVLTTNKEATVTAVNLQACNEAAIQIRLRDIAGIIMIDFIDMEDKTDQSLIEQRLREALRNDRKKTVVHGWTRLGIMEMTRKRM